MGEEGVIGGKVVGNHFSTSCFVFLLQHLQLERKNWLSPACDFRSFLGPWCPGLSAFGQLPVCLGIRIPTYSAPEAPPDPILPSLKAGGR